MKPLMFIEHGRATPRVHETAWIAPNATVSGDVTIGAGTCVLFGAVITADGGPVEIGESCVIMENAVVRGAPKQPCRLGSRALVGPQAHVTGAIVDDDAFLATGCAVFNGARIGRGAEVRIHGVVHVNSVVAEGVVVPIGWVAVGDPAELFPPGEHEAIWSVQKELDFPRTVWGVERAVPKGERTRRYAEGLRRRHRGDRLLG